MINLSVKNESMIALIMIFMMFVLALYVKSCPKENIESEVKINTIGELVTTGHFSYFIHETYFMKSIGDENDYIKTDKVFLLVRLSVINNDLIDRRVDSSLFRLTDDHKFLHKPSQIAITAMEKIDMHSMFSKTYEPSVHKNVWTAFEVPKEGKYILKIYGGSSERGVKDIIIGK